MEEDLKELKAVLRSLVVSSPTHVDARTLIREYRNMMGTYIPISKFGYRDPLAFLKEQCCDSFVFTGLPSNPTLVLIVPDTLKHIDKFVQKQKVSSVTKFKGKRRSIIAPEASRSPPQNQNDLIVKTFTKQITLTSTIEEPKKAEAETPKILDQNKENFKNCNSDHDNLTQSRNAVKNFLKKRFPLYNSAQNLDDDIPHEPDGTSSNDDSAKQPSSMSSSTKLLQLEHLKSEIMELIAETPDGIWCTDLIRLYRERHWRELNFARFGYTSIVSLAYSLEGVQVSRPADMGDWLLRAAGAASGGGGMGVAGTTPPLTRHWPRAPRASPPEPRADPDDALPGIDFDPDVFPVDCMLFMESIPTMSLEQFRPGAMVEVIVGEVYSPSHFWLIRLGENYNIAMENMMDDMTRYYTMGEGRERTLARGAIRVGHYCSSVYENDWHRSLIVKIVDSDTVKVRHVDYGTVDTVCAGALRPLRREWASLPAQALRARLAAVRPSAGGRRWPHAAAAHFLRLVQQTRLVANVVAADVEENVVEVLLIDTAGAEDVCISAQMIRAGHADSRADSALRTTECYLYPRFEALESGETPNYAEIHAYLRDGISLEYVEAYRRHVPSALPPAAPAPAPAASSAPAPAPQRPSRAVSAIVRAAPPSPPAPSSPAPSPPSPPTPPPAPPPATPAPVTPVDPAPPPPPPPLPPPSAPFPQYRTAPLPYAVEAGPPPMCVRFPPPAAYPFGAWLGPPASPPPPYGAGVAGCAGGGHVTLSVAECEAYRVLAGLDAAAAHWYMAGALSRAMAHRPRPLDPTAPEFRLSSPAHPHPHQYPPLRPPPPPRFGPMPHVRPPPGF